MFRKICLMTEKLREKFPSGKVDESLKHGFQTTKYPAKIPFRSITRYPSKFQRVVSEVFTLCQ